MEDTQVRYPRNGTYRNKGKCAFIARGFDENDFDTIKKEDAEEIQATYKDYLLYCFIKETAKGNV
ncbi:hypothetical protein [Carnobacterium sp. TMP28]|uniref:hypothetical protein n=1 Tax=Carnobacterium sp. TMP28 TaxID=3397060 RepID=UPI0039E1CB2A